jgi:hypothetical protein
VQRSRSRPDLAALIGTFVGWLADQERQADIHRLEQWRPAQTSTSGIAEWKDALRAARKGKPAAFRAGLAAGHCRIFRVDVS